MIDYDYAISSAEEEAALEHMDCFGNWNDPELFTPETLPPYFERVLKAAGWQGGHLPEIRFDIPDDHHAAGIHHFGPDGEYLRFHPKLATSWNVLHELAHWLRPRDGHGPQFCAVLIGLVRAGIDTDAARILQEQFAAYGVAVDPTWLD